MRIKKITNKLTLRKETISNLNLDELLKAKGGITQNPTNYCSILETCEGYSCPGCPRFDDEGTKPPICY